MSKHAIYICMINYICTITPLTIYYNHAINQITDEGGAEILKMHITENVFTIDKKCSPFHDLFSIERHENKNSLT